MTDCERKLWGRVRGKQLCGPQFYRQKSIGNFIVDFYCPAGKLVIEVDGGQHFSDAGLKRDQTRDQRLEAASLRVVRVSDPDVIHNIEAVLEMIHGILKETNLPQPLFSKEGYRG